VEENKEQVTATVVQEKEEKKPKHKSIRPIIYLALVAIIAVAVCIIITTTKNAKPQITSNMVIARLEKASELTTAKMICTGLVKYTDHKIPILNEEAFSMIYSAQVRAGIDLSQVEVDVTPSKVTITLPEVTIQSIEVNGDSLEFYDQKFAIFKDDSKEDVVNAIKLAKQDIEKKAEVQQLKDMAKEQTVTLLTNLFTDTIGDRTLDVQFK
jgi:hypothetical protein